MNKILTNNITSPVKQPFMAKSLDFLQESYTELMYGLAHKEFIIDPNIAMVISGLDYENTGGTIYHLNPGVVSCFGNLYYAPEQTTTIGGGQVPCLFTTTTYLAGDPVRMSDGSFENVHEINHVIISGGTSHVGNNAVDGIYLCDLVDIVRNKTYWIYPTPQTGWTSPQTSGPTLKYRKVNDFQANYVEIVGSLVDTGSPTYLLFTLPSGFRPNKQMWFPIVNTYSGDPIYFIVNTDGTCIINIAAASSPVSLGLGYIKFYIGIN